MALLRRLSFGERASRRVPEPSLWRVLVDGSEGMAEVEVRDLPADDNTGDA